ncbi:uncharacterized protein LOC129189433 isoform X2 [Dunckerocampus dactyliophorus]|uniref:uncharacterized protein LOC129189433 isoform X2 n=1 Tax=Dunckerocampus dactyliophorus TaxID=161453 RepID=UPI00240728A1|nr:uncharacterized protein LOC129189433 isoform X2 [Dunckerocampus dactyliophorus]
MPILSPLVLTFRNIFLWSRLPRILQEKMSSCVLLSVLWSLPLTTTITVGLIVLGDREEVQMVCAGKEFRLPVYSTSRIVTFTPNPVGPRRVLLEKTFVRDPRFKWTKDKMLVLKEVTHADQGLYSIKLASGFTYETVRLTVSECIKSYYRNYGENFEYNIPKNASVLEFSPRGTPSEAMPIVLWNRTNPDTSGAGRGRLLRDGKVWVAERVTQADQGNYTVRDTEGTVVSRGTLTVGGHTFNVMRSSKESLTLPLFLPVPQAYLIFSPNRHTDKSLLDPSDPPRGPVQLIREGYISNQDPRFRGLISMGRNGSINVVVIVRLTPSHDGVYEIRDSDGNLVSSTSLQVTERVDKLRAFLKSVTVPCSLFLSLTGVILFLKRYPWLTCNRSKIIACFRRNRAPQAQPQMVNIQVSPRGFKYSSCTGCCLCCIQNYSDSSPQPPGYYNHVQQPGTPRKWTPGASPVHTVRLVHCNACTSQHTYTLYLCSCWCFQGYSPVRGTTPRHTPVRAKAENREAQRRAPEASNEEERSISFPLAGASDCLHASEDCVQFQIKKEPVQERQSKANEYYSTLPLDTDTSETCSVYTSKKLNVL